MTVYDYRTIRVERGGWRTVRDDVGGSWGRRVASLGGSVFGLWSGEIGFATDEGVLVTAWPEDVGDAGSPEAVAESSAELLEPTVRPSDASPPTDPGIYAHRWFHTQSSDWDEFLELSQKGWVGFESLYDCRIVGLWLSAADNDLGIARALLLTRYASLAEWERSRPFRGEAPAGADGALYESMRDAFGRRARLTEWSVVRTTRLG